MNLQGKQGLIIIYFFSEKMSTIGQNKNKNCVTGHWNISSVLLTNYYTVLKIFQDIVDTIVYKSLWIFLIHAKKTKKLKEVLDASKVMISVKSISKIK